MSEKKLQEIIKDAENLEFNDLIKIKKVLDKALAEHRNYDDAIMSRQGAPYYT